MSKEGQVYIYSQELSIKPGLVRRRRGVIRDVTLDDCALIQAVGDETPGIETRVRTGGYFNITPRSVVVTGGSLLELYSFENKLAHTLSVATTTGLGPERRAKVDKKKKELQERIAREREIQNLVFQAQMHR